MAETVVIKDQALQALIAAFGKKTPVARVGILGDQGMRKPRPQPAEVSFESLMRRKTSDERTGPTGLEPTNAEVGARWEYDMLWHRSFLRVPLNDHLGVYLTRAGAFTKEAIDEVIRTKTLVPYVTKMGLTAELVVSDAFKTGGFGKWAPWRAGYRSNTGQILVDTQQLRNSISSEVK